MRRQTNSAGDTHALGGGSPSADNGDNDDDDYDDDNITTVQHTSMALPRCIQFIASAISVRARELRAKIAIADQCVVVAYIQRLIAVRTEPIHIH